jgi:hypothetical protein
MLSDEEIWDAYVYTQGALMGAAEGTPFPAAQRQPGQTVADLLAVRTREFAASRGVDLNWADTDRVTRLHQYNVFGEHDVSGQRRPPDAHVLAPGPGSRSRRIGHVPDDPDGAGRGAQ